MQGWHAAHVTCLGLFEPIFYLRMAPGLVTRGATDTFRYCRRNPVPIPTWRTYGELFVARPPTRKCWPLVAQKTIAGLSTGYLKYIANLSTGYLKYIENQSKSACRRSPRGCA